MKILILASFADSLVIFRGALLQAMVKKSHAVIACAPDASIELQHKLEAIGVQYQNIRIERTGLNPIKDVHTILSLWAIFRRNKPDMVLGYTIKPVIYGSLAGKLAGIPRLYSLITGLGYAFAGKDGKSRWLNRIVRMLYRGSLRYNHRIFFQNPDDLQFFENSKFVTKQQAVLINGSGVDIHAFAPVPFPETISFLLIARLIKEKGIREYTESAKIIKQKYPHIMFYLIGCIDTHPDAISKDELTLWEEQEIISYLGTLSDVRPAIAASSVYVLPSYYREGTPRTVLEAMAMGRPIITTDAPGCRETVQHENNGLLVPVRNVEALAAAMERFIQRPELIELMGRASRQMAVEKYDVRKVNAVILKTMGLE